jgi:hypothetical protein
MRDRIIRKALKDSAVFWASPVSDGSGGFVYAAPASILCRWEDKQERFVNSEAVEVTSSAVVRVDRDMSLGGILFQGQLASLSAEEIANPLLLPGARKIEAIRKIRDLANRAFERTVWL